MSNQNRDMDSFRNLIHSKLQGHRIEQPLARWNVDLCPIEMLIRRKLYSHQIAINRNILSLYQFETGIGTQLNKHQIAPSADGWARLEKLLLLQSCEDSNTWSEKQLQDQLHFHQIATPAGAWERMESSLRHAHLTSDEVLLTDLQTKLHQHTLTVPTGAWALLSANMLNETHSIESLIGSKLQTHTLTPPADGWDLLNTEVFATQIQTQLAQHQVPPKGVTWDRIVATLSTQNNSKRIVFKILVAAASLMLFVGIAYQFIDDQASNGVTAVIEDPSKTQNVTDQGSQSTNDLIEKVENKAANDIKQEPKHRDRTTKSTQIKTIVNSNLAVIDTVPTNADLDQLGISTVAQVTPNNTADQISSEAGKDSIDAHSLKVLDDLLANETNRLDKVNPSKQWLLTALVGTSQESKQAESNFSGRPATRLSSLSDTPIVVEDKRSNISHQMPLSAGLSVRRNLSKKWAVESGLTYTYLRSSFNEGQSQLSNYVQQDLHYIGVPLNAVYYITRQARWNIYSSVGGMVEKGLRNNTVTNKTMHSSHSIEGLQWSFLANVGASYQFYKGLSLYAAPHLSYYVKNKKQPFSIRTDNRFNFQIQAGLRFEF